jgi:hypothetical protein
MSDPSRLARKQRQSRQQRGQQQQQTGARVLPPPSQPMPVARAFVEQHYLYNGSPAALTLRHWHGGWWACTRVALCVHRAACAR